MYVSYSALIAVTAALSLGSAGTPPFSGGGTGERVTPAGGEVVGTSPVFIPPTVSGGPAAPAADDAGAGEASDEAADAQPAGVNPATTSAVVVTLNQATQFCGALSQTEYVIDCLAERLDDVSQRMAGTSGYEEVRTALTDASRGLNRIARQNRSAARPTASFKGTLPGGTSITTSRRLVPVDSGRMDAALSEALAVIGEAETVLLRSAENSEDRAAQFQRIANAVGSNKILLRSDA